MSIPRFGSVALALGLLLSACGPIHQNPTTTRHFPVELVPSDAPGGLTAVVPDCDRAALPPPRDDAGGWHNPDLNMGCAGARNLGLMVVNPRDLLAGRSLGPADAEREAGAMKRWREGRERPLMREEAGDLPAATQGAPSAGGQ